MATQEATLTEQVFASVHTNLTVTRFQELTDIQNGLQRKIAPGLRYEFGRSSGVLDSEGMEIPVGGSVRVTDELRRRDRQYIAKYGKHYGPEMECDPYDPDTDTLQAWLERAFLPTEEFLRKRAGETGDFREIPAVAPDTGRDFERIADLLIQKDAAGLVDLYEAEQGSWNRPEVLAKCEQALESLAQEAQPPAA